MGFGFERLAFFGAPWQILIVALLAIGLLAPHLLPRIGRMLGRTLRAEAFRRVGLPPSAKKQARHQSIPIPRLAEPEQVEITMPEHPAPTLRRDTTSTLSSAPPRRRGLPSWLVFSMAAAAASVVFWLLLHSR
jgi:Sec-independent protein translocase protein TatA